MQTIISTSAKQTIKIARQLGEKLSSKTKSPLCICLYGELGAGKTTFSKGFARGMGIAERQIKSPTFTLIRKYQIDKKVLYHCDFYRITNPDYMISEELQEIFDQSNAIALIEWPERIAKLLPKKRTNIRFEYKGKSSRKIIINS